MKGPSRKKILGLEMIKKIGVPKVDPWFIYNI